MKLALVGCGLLGGSLAAAWRRAGVASSIRGFDQERARCEQARALGLVDATATSLAEAVDGADCIVLAVPVGATASLFGELAQLVPAAAIITDVGSTKAGLMASARTALGEGSRRYVPGHPIAGGALPGLEHARADLFEGRWVVTTPDEHNDPSALECVERCWKACGARIGRLDADEHDRIFAAVSHLPHLLAFSLVQRLAEQADGARKLQFAGAGFRDFTRIAASDPAMWRDIALANRLAIGRELAGYRAGLEELQRAVDAGDGERLQRLFAQASEVRREMRFDAPAPWDDLEA